MLGQRPEANSPTCIHLQQALRSFHQFHDLVLSVGPRRRPPRAPNCPTTASYHSGNAAMGQCRCQCQTVITPALNAPRTQGRRRRRRTRHTERAPWADIGSAHGARHPRGAGNVQPLTQLDIGQSPGHKPAPWGLHVTLPALPSPALPYPTSPNLASPQHHQLTAGRAAPTAKLTMHRKSVDLAAQLRPCTGCRSDHGRGRAVAAGAAPALGRRADAGSIRLSDRDVRGLVVVRTDVRRAGRPGVTSFRASGATYR